MRSSRLRWKIQPFLILVFIALLKLVLGGVIYLMPGKTPKPWNLYGLQMPIDWLYLFAGWDSTQYHMLAANWYPSTLDPLWAYFPLYPAFMRLLGLMGLDLWLAGFVVSQIAGYASILVFHSIANAYLDEAESLAATILYFLLPSVFVFSTVSYTESLFLLFSLMTWYAHIKGREISCAFLASLTVLTRIYGLLILIPLGYDFLRRKQFKRVMLLVVPSVAFIAWFSYAFFRTGNIYAPFAAESYWKTPKVVQIQESIALFFARGDLGIFQVLLQFQHLVIIGIAFIALITWLCFRTWKIDRTLGVYSLTFLLSIGSAALAFPTGFVSLPRYLSLIFPSGLSLGIKRRWIFCFAAGLLALLDLLAWWMFLFTEAFH